MLEFQGVSKSFNGTTVVHPLDLSIEAGEVVVLLGPSGCGKTTILRMVAGWSRQPAARSWSIRFALGTRHDRAVRRKLGYVIQEGGLFPHLTGRRERDADGPARWLARATESMSAWPNWSR